MFIVHFLYLVTLSPKQPPEISSASNATVFLMFGSLIAFYKTKLKCKNCWRPHHHEVKGTHYKTCHTHLTDHDALRELHKRKFPEQHAILNKDK